MRLHHKLMMLSVAAFALPVTADEEKTAFLGVKTAPIHPTLAAQLELEENTGLAVGAALEGSPAEAAGIKQHDILAALDGTPLTSPAQLREMVLSRVPGDEVEMTIIRKAKEESIKVKLGELPEELAAAVGRPAIKRFEIPGGFDGDPFGALKMADPKAAEMLEDMMKRMDPDGVGGGMPFGGAFGPGMKMPDLPGGVGAASHSSMSINDGVHKIEMETRDGVSTLTARTADGELVYEGPYTTDDDKEAVPAEIREKVDKIKGGIRIGPGVPGGLLPDFPRPPKAEDKEPAVPTQKRTI